MNFNEAQATEGVPVFADDDSDVVDSHISKEDEYARIEASGGKVIQWNGHCVFGILAMSRSIVGFNIATRTLNLNVNFMKGRDHADDSMYRHEPFS
ncbi:hypothetical protein CQW23_16937 [Capsicum baccatum]|uniref:PPM-type phosphatase domain-containing protein n=1 Tax=Capsicum baccatum TaxID=33114 RepID=A0A2G2WCI7_CAPBA|nr:hypothetical protein CQW23_16937 [Capsicum baccatum]